MRSESAADRRNERRIVAVPISEKEFRIWSRGVDIPARESKFVVEQAWRPLVVEFSGVPRTGKTRCIKAVKEFLEHFGWRVLAPQEGAALTPAELKDRKELILFNIWAVSHALNSIIEGTYVRDRRYEAILLDRGLFDAVCWFTFLEQHQGTLSSAERRKITNFLRLNRWYDSVDILVLFMCRASISARRESEISVSPGEHMTANLNFLSGLRKQYASNVSCYPAHDAQIVILNTSQTTEPRATAVPIIDEILYFVEEQRSIAIGD